jgi:hypothetical protein
MSFVPSTAHDVRSVYAQQGYGSFWQVFTLGIPVTKRDQASYYQRAAARHADQYKECCKEKGAKDKKCVKLAADVEKYMAKAEEHEAQLAAEGKTGRIERSKSGQVITDSTLLFKGKKTKSGTTPIKKSSFAAGPVESGLTVETVEESAGSRLPLIIGGVTALGLVGGIAYVVVMRRKKKAKRKELLAGA